MSVTVSRNGDLINNVFLELTLTKSGATFYPAEAILSTVELEIGGQTVKLICREKYRACSELYIGTDKTLSGVYTKPQMLVSAVV